MSSIKTLTIQKYNSRGAATCSSNTNILRFLWKVVTTIQGNRNLQCSLQFLISEIAPIGKPGFKIVIKNNQAINVQYEFYGVSFLLDDSLMPRVDILFDVYNDDCETAAVRENTSSLYMDVEIFNNKVRVQEEAAGELFLFQNIMLQCPKIDKINIAYRRHFFYFPSRLTRSIIGVEEFAIDRDIKINIIPSLNYAIVSQPEIEARLLEVLFKNQTPRRLTLTAFNEYTSINFDKLENSALLDLRNLDGLECLELSFKHNTHTSLYNLNGGQKLKQKCSMVVINQSQQQPTMLELTNLEIEYSASSLW